MDIAGVEAVRAQPRTERQRNLARALAAQGADIRRLEFLRWLIANGRHPEWSGEAVGRTDYGRAPYSCR
jgi:hypothetical protein